jgi:hypothetical protein
VKDENERRVVQERVVQTPQGAQGPQGATAVVEERTSVLATPAERSEARLHRAKQGVWLLFGILSGLIAIRTALVAMGADMTIGFGALARGVTQPFDLPFLMLFGEQAKATSRTPYFEVGGLVAIVVYLLLAWVITMVLELVMEPRRHALAP